MNNSEIRFYVDTMIVQTVLDNSGLQKKADSGILSDLVNGVKNYVSSHIDPNDKSGSLLNILAPGAISVAFSAMGLGKIGLLFGLAMNVFHIDVKSILSSIYDKIKGLISGNSKATSSQIDNIVNSSVKEHVGETETPLISAMSFKQELRDAKIMKLALMSYDKEIISVKESNSLPPVLAISRKGKLTSILAKVLSWIFKISLASGGFMVAGDAVNKLLDRPNAFDGTIRDGKPVETIKAPIIKSTPTSTQTKFPVKSNYVDTQYNLTGTNWIEKVNNNKANIENMLVSFVKEVYDGLQGQESLIKSVPGFQITADNIAWYNHSAVGDPIVFIPKIFTSKKQLVDYFIDQVAAKATSIPNNQNNVSPNLPPGSYLV